MQGSLARGRNPRLTLSVVMRQTGTQGRACLPFMCYVPFT